MASWNNNPSWVSPSGFNRGNTYQAADGVTYNDINSIIEDLIYLYQHSGGGGAQPTLYSIIASIALSLNQMDKRVIIDANAANGNFVEGYKVYAGDTLIYTGTSTSILLASIIPFGTSSIYASAYATNFNDSQKVLAGSVTKYSIVYNFSNLVATSGSMNYIIDGCKAVINMQATNGYKVPSRASISVTNCSIDSYQIIDDTHSVLTITGATGNVVINAQGVADQFDINTQLTNITLDPSSDTVIDYGSTAQLIFKTSIGYIVPQQSSISITGASIVSYVISSDEMTGTLTIGNPTADVYIIAEATEVEPMSNFILSNGDYMETFDEELFNVAEEV